MKLLDFGIAPAEFDEREAETSQVLLGSVSYMAPERLDLVSGPGNDVYALAVTLAECVTAVKMPRTSANADKHAAHVEQVLQRVRERHAGPVADAFVALLGEMMAYAPDRRPTAREVDRRLRELRAQAPPPWLRDWAEEHVRPDQRRPYDDRSGVLLGRTCALADESPPRARPRARPALARWLAVAGVLGLLGTASAAVAVALAAWAVTRQPEPPVPPVPPVAAPVAPAPAPAPAPLPVPAPDPAPAVAPEAPPKPAPPRPAPAPEPRGEPAPPPQAAAQPVGAAAFAEWLAAHPEWAPARAMADGRADASYLRGWVDGAPPASPRWAVDVSWAAAEAYCAGRGGLAPVDALPASWPEDGGPIQEWRVAGGRPAWRRYDGATSTAVKRSEANGFTGFRCAR